MTEFQPGDFVRLKGGSRLMVVQAVKGAFAECAWLSLERTKPQTETDAFPVRMLEKAEPPPPGAYRVFSDE